MNNYIIQIPATIDLEVQAQDESQLLPAIKECLADFYYTINPETAGYVITDTWKLKD